MNLSKGEAFGWLSIFEELIVILHDKKRFYMNK